jgi:hypothetical protein
MASFTPPARSECPPVLPEGDPAQSREAFRLYRYFKARPVGITIYRYKAGSVTAGVLGEISETAPYASYNSNGVLTSDGWQDIAQVWWGGHDNVPISNYENTILTAAGYTTTP